jgi:hypothetical protein
VVVANTAADKVGDPSADASPLESRFSP